MTRIEWEPHDGGYRQIGKVNDLHVFTIRHSYIKCDKPWRMGSFLPIRPKGAEDAWPFAELDDAKDFAESVLIKCMAELGAVFKDEIGEN